MVRSTEQGVENVWATLLEALAETSAYLKEKMLAV